MSACETGEFIKISDNEGVTESYCASCGDNCDVCTDENTCTQCADTFFLQADHTCISPCPSGSPAFTDEGGIDRCGDCFENCETCTTSRESDQCATCKAATPYFTDNGSGDGEGTCDTMCVDPAYHDGGDPGACVTECPAGWGPQDSDRSCYECDPLISGCGECKNTDGAWVCEACAATHPFTNEDGNACYSSCPAGTVLNPTSDVCFDELPLCDDSYYNSEFDEIRCNACTGGAFTTQEEKCTSDCSLLDQVTIGTQCFDSCPTGQGPDESNMNTCKDCTVDGCTGCVFEGASAVEYCRTCDSALYWYENPTGSSPLCLTAYECANIDDYTYGLAHDDMGAVIVEDDGSNINQCTLCGGYYDFKNKNCEDSCSMNCALCGWDFDEESSVCYECDEGARYHVGNLDCIDTCDISYPLKGTVTVPGPRDTEQDACLSSCPAGQAPND